ncbi:DUF3311 domain-containing protein [Fodinisporobacter ferrooxydans]|uniref:DUF3311 domain-containing protein n=1 Tax=Fodinisporobacter ferrooxydans TaxID=2901836 RepID=A0ABY4CHI2_9BACL|nr:DUF3311 domain-containing protein [Alicyclobacillaceae bacterium MYW30-H2]
MRRVIVFLLVLIPFIAQLLLIPMVNHVQPVLFGLPFLHFWLFIWMLLTPLFTLAVHRILKPSSEE